MTSRWIACTLVCLVSCGYRAVYGGEGGEKLSVVLGRSMIPDAVASGEVVSGVREVLAKEGMLASGSGYPRIEVEVLRADEASEGIVAPGADAGPVARATEQGLVGRAYLTRTPGGPEERDTGDVRAMDLVASGQTGSVADPRLDMFHHEDALRLVARRLGERLGWRVLGIPAANDEGIGRSP